jgi:hypothetical protein
MDGCGAANYVAKRMDKCKSNAYSVSDTLN